MKGLLPDNIKLMMEAMKSVFSNRLIIDERVPIATLELFGRHFGILAPNPAFWTYLYVLFILQAIAIICFAAIIYKFIVQQRGSFTSYLVGYGILIPLALQLPFWALDMLELDNQMIKMSILSLPVATLFRCLEAMHNTSPRGVESCLPEYLMYAAAVVEFQRDEATGEKQRVSRRVVLTTTWQFLIKFAMLSLLMSFLLHHDFRVFSSKLDLTSFHLMDANMIHPGQLLNNYLVAILFYLCLNLGLTGAQFINYAVGYATVPPFRNPFLRSMSVADFWGRRWNMVAHGMYKRGVFQPLRPLVGVKASIVAVFLVSGLLHEYAWRVIFYNSSDGDKEVAKTSSLKLTAFFLWCGVTMILERPFYSFEVRLPRPVVATLVVLTAIPVSHWFTGDLIDGGYFRHNALGLFLIVPLD